MADELFKGIDQVVANSFGIPYRGDGKNSFTMTAARKFFSARSPQLCDPLAMIQEAMQAIEGNLAGGEPVNPEAARKNWKWEKSLHWSAEQKADGEKLLEKLIASFMEGDWVNQVPVCNGLTTDRANNHCVDLAVRCSKTEYDLIELKYSGKKPGPGGSDNPLYAARELLGYACVYLLHRQNASLVQLVSRDHHLLKAKRVNLVVLAPKPWYTLGRSNKEFNLGSFARAITVGLQEYVKSQARGTLISLTFRFDVLSSQFEDVYHPLAELAPDFKKIMQQGGFRDRLE